MVIVIIIVGGRHHVGFPAHKSGTSPLTSKTRLEPNQTNSWSLVQNSAVSLSVPSQYFGTTNVYTSSVGPQEFYNFTTDYVNVWGRMHVEGGV